MGTAHRDQDVEMTYRRGRLGEGGVPDLQLCHRDHQDWGDAMEGAELYAKAGMQEAPPAFRNMAFRSRFQGRFTCASSGLSFRARLSGRMALMRPQKGRFRLP